MKQEEKVADQPFAGSALRPTTIISLCGVDGAGKSTALALLEKDSFLADAVYVRRKTSVNIDYVELYHKRHHSDGRDWVVGTFSKSAAYAWALDILNYYHSEIAPWVGKKAYIVCDRYTTCAIAFARVVDVSLVDLFHGVPAADLTIHVDVDVNLLSSRFEKRGGPGDDENAHLLPKLALAYHQVIGESRLRHIRIGNNSSIDEMYDALARELRAYVATIERPLI